MHAPSPPSTLGSNPEFIQGLVRLALGLFIIAYMGLGMALDHFSISQAHYLAFAAVILLADIAILASIVRFPALPRRKYAALAFDVSTVAGAMLVTGAGPFSPFYLFYLWIYIGYGTRYGRDALLAATLFSLLSYLLVLRLSPGWEEQFPDPMVQVLVLLVVPLYLNAMAASLRRARYAAEHASQAKGEFLATMSHEIRTPMSAIVGMANLLSKSPLSTEQREYADSLRASANALHELIDDILDLAKIEAGKYGIAAREFNPSAIVQGVALMFTPTASAKNIELVSYVEPDLPRKVIGDGNRLRQVLLNLISNAVKFTERGEVFIRVFAVERSTESVRLRVEVLDTGIGIPDEDLARIFEPFYQSDHTDTRRHGGTGLGTTISRELVLLMGGQIGVMPRPRGGSCFWFELPLACPTGAPSPRRPLHGEVLLLEDNLNSRTTLLDYLRALGLQPQAASDEQDLLERLRPTTALVMLADSNGSGSRVALAEQIRARWPQVRLARLTFLERLGGEAETRFDCQLVKPVALEALHRTLADVRIGTDSPPPVNAPVNALSPGLTPTSQAAPLRILIAEDSDVNARILTAFLEKAGHSVQRAVDGHTALAALTAERWDLVLMDVRMPGMGGIEATRCWRAQEPADRRTPIVALTANAAAETRDSCLAAGMDDFLAKPVSPEKLAELIRRMRTGAAWTIN